MPERRNTKNRNTKLLKPRTHGKKKIKLSNKLINQLKPVFLKLITYCYSNRKIPPVSPSTHNPTQPKTKLDYIGLIRTFCSDVYL